MGRIANPSYNDSAHRICRSAARLSAKLRLQDDLDSIAIETMMPSPVLFSKGSLRAMAGGHGSGDRGRLLFMPAGR